MLPLSSESLLEVPDINTLGHNTFEYTSRVVGSTSMYYDVNSLSENKLSHLVKELEDKFPYERRKIILTEKILSSMPNSFWDIEEYNILISIFNEEIGPEEVNKLKTYFSGDYRELFQAYSVLLNKLATGCRKYSDLWRQVSLHESDRDKIKVETEIALTFDKVNKVCIKAGLHMNGLQRFPERAVTELFPLIQRISLLFIRLSEISYLLDTGNFNDLPKRIDYLRTERYEVDFYAHS